MLKVNKNNKLLYDFDLIDITNHIMYKCTLESNTNSSTVYVNEGLFNKTDKYDEIIIQYSIYGYNLINDTKVIFDKLKYYFLINGLDKYIKVNRSELCTITIRYRTDKIDKIKTYFRLKGII